MSGRSAKGNGPGSSRFVTRRITLKRPGRGIARVLSELRVWPLRHAPTQARSGSAPRFGNAVTYSKAMDPRRSRRGGQSAAVPPHAAAPGNRWRDCEIVYLAARPSRPGPVVAAAAVLLISAACGAGGPTDGAGGGPAARSESSERFGFGRPATAEEIAAVDMDVGPDGLGLPPGSGSVAEGAEVYAARCAVCHGATGREGPEDELVGTEPADFPFGDDPASLGARTIGTYWPYATTLFDYIRRAMPLNEPGSLSNEEVYALTAWLLSQNDVIAEDAVMNATTLPQVRMPARDRFVRDDREASTRVR